MVMGTKTGVKTSNDVPTWNDIAPHISLPLMVESNSSLNPDGGTYTIGRIDQLPTCSIGGPGSIRFSREWSNLIFGLFRAFPGFFGHLQWA